MIDRDLVSYGTLIDAATITSRVVADLDASVDFAFSYYSSIKGWDYDYEESKKLVGVVAISAYAAFIKTVSDTDIAAVELTLGNDTGDALHHLMERSWIRLEDRLK